MKSEYEGRAAAEALAATIRHYWWTRGYQPEVWVEHEGGRIDPDGLGYGWVVKSDMVDGWPKCVQSA